MTRLWRRRGMDEMRRITTLFIDDSPSTIRLVPHKRINQPGGTHKWEPQKPRRPQTFRLIPVGFTTDDGLKDEEGQRISGWTYHLIGDYNAEMEIGDSWTWKNQQYRIRAMLPANNWERRAIVTQFGKAPPENLPSKEIGQPPWVEEGWNKFTRPKSPVGREISNGD